MATGQVITTEGKKIALNRTFKTSPDYSAPTVFKVGTNGTSPSITQTDLLNPIPIADQEIVDNCDSTSGWSDSADMTVSVNSDILKFGVGALNLTKDGNSSSNASTSKTVTNLDFDDKRLEFFLYIADQATLDKLTTTDCVMIRYGSDSSNYYQWTRDKSNLNLLWNYINNLTDDNEDTVVGAPDNNNMDYFFIQLDTINTSDTWIAGKVIMEDIRIAGNDDFTKVFVTGYPTFDETNLQASIRCFLNSLEANGHDLVEFGIFNTDSSAKMWSRSVFTIVSKTDTIEMTFVQKDKMT